jgi:hypothetical protein
MSSSRTGAPAERLLPPLLVAWILGACVHRAVLTQARIVAPTPTSPVPTEPATAHAPEPDETPSEPLTASTDRVPWVWLRPIRGPIPIAPLDEEGFLPFDAARTEMRRSQSSCDEIDQACIADSNARCDHGEADACLLVGIEHLTGGVVSQNVAQAVSRLKRGCTLHNGRACSLLGDLTAKGVGVRKDPARAVVLYSSACGPDAYGCLRLGRAYERGEGIAKNPKMASDLYDNACYKKDPRGCFQVATRMAETSGLPSAERLYSEICNKGLGIGCRGLAEVWESYGRPDAAAVHYRTGCDLGDGGSCARLAASAAVSDGPR